VNEYQHWQRQRMAVPPGMTGWWQVNGRSERMMHLHVEDDLYYVNHYSIWLDLWIMLKTGWVILSGRGAY
jgi:lipopolysaccharide/colanic/teichoic acid biosynthesis glycosyltransferase